MSQHVQNCLSLFVRITILHDKVYKKLHIWQKLWQENKYCRHQKKVSNTLDTRSAFISSRTKESIDSLDKSLYFNEIINNWPCTATMRTNKSWISFTDNVVWLIIVRMLIKNIEKHYWQSVNNKSKITKTIRTQWLTKL